MNEELDWKEKAWGGVKNVRRMSHESDGDPLASSHESGDVFGTLAT